MCGRTRKRPDIDPVRFRGGRPGRRAALGMEATTALGMVGDGGLEDFILTSGEHYHLVRPIGAAQSLLVYLCVERARANLASARRELASARPDEFANAVPPAPRQRRSPAVSRKMAMPLAASPPARRRVTDPRQGAVAVPLPRRTGSTAVPAAAPAPPRPRASSDPVLAQPWADDIATMNRLLTALRALSNDANST